jgi:hypothetical protein
MAIHFACNKCQTPYLVNDSNAGMQFDCKVCGQPLQVPTQRQRPRPAPSEPIRSRVEQIASQTKNAFVPPTLTPNPREPLSSPSRKRQPFPLVLVIGLVSGVGLLSCAGISLFLFGSLFRNAQAEPDSKNPKEISFTNRNHHTSANLESLREVADWVVAVGRVDCLTPFPRFGTGDSDFIVETTMASLNPDPDKHAIPQSKMKTMKTHYMVIIKTKGERLAFLMDTQLTFSEFDALSSRLTDKTVHAKGRLISKGNPWIIQHDCTVEVLD